MELLLRLTKKVVMVLLINLHSNMELLLLVLSQLYNDSEKNLHSNMELLLRLANQFLYFENVQFTFQYGATATSLCRIKTYMEKVFTFQYGATATLYLINP